MTLKKSLISVAAAGLLVSAITGCSSDSTTPVVTTTTTNPTSITAIDGYIHNYTVTATYGDGNESNVSYATTSILANAVTDAKTVAGSGQTAGSAVMDLSKDLTASQIANLKSITLSRKAQVTSTDGTTLTYATFFDVDGDGKFTAANGDTYAPPGFSLTAPVGYKVITPVTTLVQQRIAQLTATDTNESTRATKIATAETQVINALGLTADKIKNIDPINTVATDPAYALINAMLGQAVIDGDMATLATSIATATAATTPSAALNNIAAGAPTSAAFYTSAATQLAADANMINDVKTWNLDALRNNAGGAQTAFTPTKLAAFAQSDFNASSVVISNSDVSLLAGSGAKVDFGGLNDTNITLSSAGDANVSNKQFKLAIDIRKQQEWVSDEANISSLTIVIPFDLNSTHDNAAATKIQAAVSGNVMWEGVNGAGATFTGEMNASEFTNATGSSGTSGLTNGGISVASSVANFKIGDIITTIDGNSSNAAGIIDNNVSAIKVALVDVNGSVLQRVSGQSAQYWGNTQVASVKGGINVTGKTILNNSYVDGRVDNTQAAANLKPAVALTFGGTVGTTSTAITGSGTTAAPWVLGNNSPITNLDIGLSTNDAHEKNTTITITASNTTDLELNTSSLLAGLVDNSDPAAVTAGSEFNSSSVAVGDVNYTITTVATDEFGEVNTSTYYLMYDRAPYVNVVAFTGDSNQATLLSDYDTNTTLSTITTGGIQLLENNGTLTTVLVGTTIDFNATDDAVWKLYFSPAGKLEVNGTSGTDANFTVVEINVSDAHGIEFNSTLYENNYSF